MRGFLKQSAAYGRGEVTYRAVCAAHGRAPNVVSHSFYGRLLGAALRRGPRRGVPLAGLAAASQLAFLATYWTARARRVPAW
jgi:hypothetical protein